MERVNKTAAKKPRRLAAFWWREHDTTKPESRADRERNHSLLCAALADMAAQKREQA